MSINKSIYKPYINPRLKKFFNDHDNTINLIFNTLKLYKPNIVNSYYFSKDNPPSHPRYKYTDKLYLACIFYIILYGSIGNLLLVLFLESNLINVITSTINLAYIKNSLIIALKNILKHSILNI